MAQKIQLNSNQLKRIIAESVKKVLREMEEMGENPEEIFDNIYPFNNENTEIDVIDSDNGRINVCVEENGWKFAFEASGWREGETDLVFSVKPGEKMYYCSPDGNKGSWVNDMRLKKLVKNYFDYDNAM